MRFGSVEFFKVLIKTVLAVVFFTPLVAAVILGVFLVNKNKQIKELNTENLSLSAAADVLIQAKAGTAEDFYTIFGKSGVSYNELLRLIYSDSKLSADEIYNALSNAGVSDKDIVTIAASKQMINGEEFYGIMTKNGVSDKELLTAVINKNAGSPESLRALLKACGLNDAELAQIANGTPSNSSGSGGSNSTPGSGNSGSNEPPHSTPGSNSSTSNNPPESTGSSSTGGSTSEPVRAEYMSKYPDMYVTAPTSYVSPEKTVYLTFDDGPSNNVYTIINYILNKRGVKATFFVVTDPSQNPDLATKLKYIADNGHAIGIHSNTHDYEKIYASVDAFLDDFYLAWTKVYEATGIKTGIFRFPGGSNTDYNVDTREEIIAEMTRRGFRYYDWNVQSNDILGYNWSQMWNGVCTNVTNTKGHSIVLFHDRADNAVTVLDDIIVRLQGDGYKFDKINDNTMPIQFVKPSS